MNLIKLFLWINGKQLFCTKSNNYWKKMLNLQEYIFLYFYFYQNKYLIIYLNKLGFYLRFTMINYFI